MEVSPLSLLSFKVDLQIPPLTHKNTHTDTHTYKHTNVYVQFQVRKSNITCNSSTHSCYVCSTLFDCDVL